MLWNKARPSDNVNDTRQGKDARQLTGKTFGAGLAVTALASAGMYSALSTTPGVVPVGSDTPAYYTAPHPAADRDLLFVQSVLGDTEDTWTQLFAQTGRHYPPPRLTLLSNDINSRCGIANAGSGPFYCPDDQQVYLDLAFFSQMAQRFSVIGEFAQAYVLAHEIGHHVQLELGISEPFEKALATRQPVAGDGGLEVRAELQADCLAGVWAHHAQKRLEWLEPGDIDAALHAAAVFGDDALQRAQHATIRPQTFSHGTSEQRANWFKSGFATGRIDTCDTFNRANL